MPLPPNAGREVALAGISGALALISPAGLSPRALTAYRVTSATLAGAYTYDSLRRDEVFAAEPAARVALAAGASGALFGTMGLWERWDGALHRWLGARGVKHPRLVIAAGTTATSLISGLLDARASRADEEDEDETGPSLAALDPRLRTLLAGVLADTDDFSAPVLRQQLALAQAEVWDHDEEPGDELPAFVGLAVAGAHDVARAVPRTFVFPVHAAFEHDGTTFEAAIEIQDGLLSNVMLSPTDQSATFDDSVEEPWPTTWPAVEDVRLRHESSSD